jgi:hypothetical protein
VTLSPTWCWPWVSRDCVSRLGWPWASSSMENWSAGPPLDLGRRRVGQSVLLQELVGGVGRRSWAPSGALPKMPSGESEMLFLSSFGLERAVIVSPT